MIKARLLCPLKYLPRRHQHWGIDTSQNRQSTATSAVTQALLLRRISRLAKEAPNRAALLRLQETLPTLARNISKRVRKTGNIFRAETRVNNFIASWDRAGRVLKSKE